MTEIQPAKTVPADWYPSLKHPGLLQYWDGTNWTDNLAPIPPQQQLAYRGKAYKTSHGFHLFMSIITCGLWALFVWLPMGIYNSVKNK